MLFKNKETSKYITYGPYVILEAKGLQLLSPQAVERAPYSGFVPTPHTTELTPSVSREKRGWKILLDKKALVTFLSLQKRVKTVAHNSMDHVYRTH